MEEIIEASELPVDCKVYLRKDILGYRVVEPWKDPKTGKINWLRLIFGSRRTVVMTLSIMAIVLLLYFGITELIGVYKTVAANPCAYCSDCQQYVTNFLDKYYSGTKGFTPLIK